MCTVLCCYDFFLTRNNLEFAKNGCPWDEETCSKAAEGGHLTCLEYAHINGCLPRA